jgi:Heparinase II/III-like protein/Heparinase II/III N-terminus
MAVGRRMRMAAAGALLAVLTGTALVSPVTAYGQSPVRATPSPVIPGQPSPVPLVPDPPALGYIPPFAPATAPPATDIRPRSTVAPLAPNYTTYPCPGYSGLQTTNPLASVMTDRFTWSTFAPVKVGNGAGNVNWRLNPYKNASWYMWLHSLRWVGQAINAGLTGNVTALNHARAIAKDWIRDNPYPWTNNAAAHESTMHRTNVLICLREAIMRTSPGSTLPAADAWLNTALLSHARFIQNYWSGPGDNHGTDESTALLGVGCLLGRTDLRNQAITRLSQGITTAIDPQGASNEQSTSYAQFNYSLWGRAENALITCNITTGTTIPQRRRLLANFVAQSTNALGKLAQIGDSEVVNAVPFPGTDAEWAGSAGTRGRAPAVRSSRYTAGYAFGRTGWGTGSRPFRQESFYSLHYGPARRLHGHFDHTSLTYVARGRDILIDGGHPGYVAGAWRTWAMSGFAHNVMTVPTATVVPSAATRLSRSAYLNRADFFEVTGQPYVGVSRVRAVLVLRDPDLIVTLDRGTSSRAQQWQTLWHLPSGQSARVFSRTTAIASRPGDITQTIAFQVPFRQALPPGAILVQRGLTTPRIQGWHYPSITRRTTAPTLMFARSATTATILSVIVPLRQGAGVTYRLRAAAGGWTNLSLNIGGVPALVRISPGNALVRG